MQKFQDWCQFQGNYLHITFHSRRKHSHNKWGRGGLKPSYLSAEPLHFSLLHSFKLMLKFQVWYQFKAQHLWINFCPTGKHFDKKMKFLGDSEPQYCGSAHVNFSSFIQYDAKILSFESI